MNQLGDFELAKWGHGDHNGLVKISAAGSQGPAMSLNDLKAISTDPEATSAALNFDDMKLTAAHTTTDAVTHHLASFYDSTKVFVQPSDILLAHGTTGANSIVLQGLLSPGDHVISTFPTYAPLFSLAKACGATLSFLRLRDENNWTIDIPELEALIKPETKMLILNNPHNPTGSTISTSTQAALVALAAKHDLILFCDEIFRPLFHIAEHPSSFLEHASKSYDRIVVTGSLSKAWGFAGVRIGWAATTSPALREKMRRVREWILQEVGEVDKRIAGEVLGPRCCSAILAKNLEIARENWGLLREFLRVWEGSVRCVVPTGGSTAFVRFLRKGGEGGEVRPVDDLLFCQGLLEETGVLVSPGRLCFGPDEEELKGYVRMHICIPPDNFRRAIEGLERFLKSDRFAKIQ
ncbi:uncharacterized protein LTR77_003992 [Saxophila tyrrhenica]|uniref:Aminotransferase class I/classII large domain-containing protein n=1 Tax=Saxophila tyrrhenica TaxID=1690608 RepID=A0AAV9PFD5_9PEZI|nr:hypothetical protein LTR77_003992 [Saxophila tyrrhenica]